MFSPISSAFPFTRLTVTSSSNSATSVLEPSFKTMFVIVKSDADNFCPSIISFLLHSTSKPVSSNGVYVIYKSFVISPYTILNNAVPFFFSGCVMVYPDVFSPFSFISMLPRSLTKFAVTFISSAVNSCPSYSLSHNNSTSTSLQMFLYVSSLPYGECKLDVAFPCVYTTNSSPAERLSTRVTLQSGFNTYISDKL